LPLQFEALPFWRSDFEAFVTSNLQQVIATATTRDSSVSDVLRTCLVLAYELDNDALKTWVENELNGYPAHDEVPDYRRIRIVAKGFFVGSFGRQIHDQPLASHILEPEHRGWAETHNLMQPIAAYEEFARKPRKTVGSVTVDWPPSLTTRYQTKFFQNDDLVLNRAWQEIPGSALVGVIDIVRNRALKFALELRKELGRKDDVASLPKERVEQMVTNYIFGGNVVVAGHAQHFSQTTIAPGDKANLLNALKQFGLSDADAGELIEATGQDRIEAPHATTLGQRTLTVLERVATGGLKIGAEVAKPAITAMLMQYLGLPHS
jgi:hypothetical protein